MSVGDYCRKAPYAVEPGLSARAAAGVVHDKELDSIRERIKELRH